jgi:3-hydroxy-3-methylglutaryl CoA synthase
MNPLFIAQNGTVKDTDNMNHIRDFIMNNFKSQMQNRETFHQYIHSMPTAFQEMVEKVKHSDEITTKICEQFKSKCNIKFLDNNYIHSMYF